MIRFLHTCLVFSIAISAWANDQDANQPKGIAIAKQGTPKLDGKIDDRWKACPKHAVALPIAESL